MSQVILNQAGPLPIKVNVKWPTSSPVVVAVSGSAWTQKANTTLAVELNIHATNQGMLQQFANAASTHFAFPTTFFAVNGAIGDATLTLSAANDTTVTDQNDHFSVAIIY